MLQIPSKVRANPGRAVALAAGTALSLVVVVGYASDALTGYLMDLSVFRDAGRAFVGGLPLYSADFPSTSGFRFIYPPFAAILFAPLAALNPDLLQVLWSALNIFLVWWILKVTLGKLMIRRPELVALAALGPALLLEPVRSNFIFGQINIILVALVVADATGVIPKRFRGIGIGVAAAIKITPAAFLLLLLVRKDFRSLSRAVATIIASMLVGFWILPKDSSWFWTTEVFATDRAGAPDFVRNQAVTGLLARLGADGMLKDGLWLLSVLAIVAAAAWSARRFTQTGEHIVAMAIVALASLLAAPFAVTHHWVYCVFLIPIMLAPQYRSWRPLIGSAIAIFLIGPYFALSLDASGSKLEAAMREVIGNSQCLIALVLLAAAVVAARSLTPPAPDERASTLPARDEVLTPALV